MKYVARKEDKFFLKLTDGFTWVAKDTDATHFTTEQATEETLLACGEMFFSVIPFYPPAPVPPPPPPPFVPPKGAPRLTTSPPPSPPMREGGCPQCGSEMEMKTAYFGEFWRCTKERCSGFRTAKGTYMRVGQMAEKEIAGIPLLEVTREGAGRYVSEQYVLRFVPAKKVVGRREKQPAYWEAFDKFRGEVVLTESSCVRLRMALAPKADT